MCTNVLPRPRLARRPGAAGPGPSADPAGPLRGLRGRGGQCGPPLPHRGQSPRRRPGPPRLPARTIQEVRREAKRRGPRPWLKPPRVACLAEGVEPQAARGNPAGGRERQRLGKGFGGRPALTRTWLQVMNSLVWVSSTSVHSLLRKAGTFELCFIVNEAQGLPNSTPERGVNGGCGSGGGSCSPRTPTTQAQQPPGPAPQPRQASSELGGRRPHVTDKSPHSARTQGGGRTGPVSGQSQAPTARHRKVIGCCRPGVGGSRRGHRLLLRLLYGSLCCSGSPT